VELHPVRAGMVKTPEERRWSRAGPHMKGHDDILVNVDPVQRIILKPRSPGPKRKAKD